MIASCAFGTLIAELSGPPGGIATGYKVILTLKVRAVTDTTQKYEESEPPVGKWLLCAALAIGIVVILFAVLLPRTGSFDKQELRVRVFVADGDTHQPLSSVPVSVMYWAEEPYGGDWTKTASQRLVGRDHQQFVTDDRGTVEFPWNFEAIIGTNAFGKSGTFLSNTWVEIAPPGYGAVLLPLDGQSAKRRDYANRTPIVVTIFLKKPSGAPITPKADSGTHN